MISGFLYTTRDKHFFYKSDGKNITKAIVCRFIDEIEKNYDLCHSHIIMFKSSDVMIKDFKRDMSRATIEKMSKNGYQWYRISGKGFQINYPIADFDRKVIVFE